MRQTSTASILLVSAWLAAACLASTGVAASGQTVKQYGPTPPPKEKLFVDKTHPAPFDSSGGSGRAQPIEYRTLEQMTAQDREVAANAESSIGEHTKFADLEFNQDSQQKGSWSYEQVVCPALPQHVFLSFRRNNGVGDVSMFTASIPRGGEGQVRIIPIQLRGYSLFSPAPVNAMTVAAFNKIWAEENPDRAPAPEWLGVGLCYAALAGGHPQLPPVDDDAVPKKLIAENKGILEVSNGGGAVMTFNDVSVPKRTMNWSLSFDRNGKLLKASHSAAQPIRVIVVKPNPVNTNPKAVGMPVGMTEPPQQSQAVPPAPGAVAMHPVPPQAVAMKTVPQAN
jgi:hypothetical protein